MFASTHRWFYDPSYVGQLNVSLHRSGVKVEERNQRLQHIQAYAKAMIQGVRIMDERRHILQPLLRDEAVRNALNTKFKNTYGAHAYNHLVPLLAQDLVRDLARLYLDDDRRAGSFVNLHRKAADPAMHKALKEYFRSLPDKWHEQPGPIEGLSVEASDRIRDSWRDKDREDFAKSFSEGWATVTAAMAELQSDPVAEKIKTFRDKYHAHLEMAPLGKDPGPFDVANLGLTYNDLLSFADRYMPALFELARVLTGHVHDVEGFSEVHRKYGEGMWRVLAGVA